MTVRELVKLIEEEAALESAVWNMNVMVPGHDHSYRRGHVIIDDINYGNGEQPLFALIIE